MMGEHSHTYKCVTRIHLASMTVVFVLSHVWPSVCIRMVPTLFWSPTLSGVLLIHVALLSYNHFHITNIELIFCALIHF